MAMVVELRKGDGSLVRRIPDPSGGTFDAAGDFDRLLDDESYPTLSQVSTYGKTELGIPAMPNLLADIRAALETARPGAETRGLLRLQRLAEHCQDGRGLRLPFIGD